MENYASNLPFLLTVLLLVLGFLAVLKRWKNAGDTPLPPGPRGLPFLGYLPFLGKLLHHDFAELARTYGPIYKLWVGNKLWMVITSPSLAKEISRDHDMVFANRDAIAVASIITFDGKDIAFAEYGPYWKKMRKMFVQEVIRSSSLDASYSALRREEVKKSISSLYNTSGSPIDIGELSQLHLINAIMAMLWGHTVKGAERETLSSEFRKLLGDLMVLLGKPNISDIFPVLAKFDLQGLARQAKSIGDRIDYFLDSAIACAVEGKANNGIKDDVAGNHKKKKDILQLFLDLQTEGGENSSSTITSREIKAVLMDIFIGGTDTTSTTLAWVMTKLLQHKLVLQKVMEELTEVVGLNSLVEEFHLPKLTYLDAVIKETLRLHPALPLLVPRSPTQSVTIGGYMIPKDSKVFLNIWAIQRDPELWENPLDFKPERFLVNSGKLDFSGNNFVYLPFGAGRRICAGIPLAEKMLKYMLASFLHSFEWELLESTTLEASEKLGLVVKKLKPLVAIPRPRLSNSELYE